MRSFFKRIERNSMERLQQQLNFLLEMDKEKSIKDRQDVQIIIWKMMLNMHGILL